MNCELTAISSFSRSYQSHQFVPKGDEAIPLSFFIIFFYYLTIVAGNKSKQKRAFYCLSLKKRRKKRIVTSCLFGHRQRTFQLQFLLNRSHFSSRFSYHCWPPPPPPFNSSSAAATKFFYCFQQLSIQVATRGQRTTTRRIECSLNNRSQSIIVNYYCHWRWEKK